MVRLGLCSRPVSVFRGLRLAVGLLTIVPVRITGVDRDAAKWAMMLAPLVGAGLGVAAGAVMTGTRWLGASGLLAAVLGVGVLALLTRGLHLDGLADLADGLGSGKPAERALEIMRRSDIGPFGVAVLLFTVLVQIAAITSAGTALVLLVACVTGRLALTWACRQGVPAARQDGLGVLVAGTVGRGAALCVTALVLAATAAIGLAAQAGVLGALSPLPSSEFPFGPFGVDEAYASRLEVMLDPPMIYPMDSHPPHGLAFPPPAVVFPGAVLAGLVAARVVRRGAVRRLGGITGDVLGALVEISTAVTLLVCALAL